MYSKVKSQNPLEVVTLSQAKSQLEIIDDDTQDTHIQMLIDASSELAEGYTNRMLSDGIAVVESIGCQEFRLPYGEVTDADTPFIVTVNNEAAQYQFNELSQRIKILEKTVYPDDVVYVEYSAGYKKDDIPNTAKMGTMMIIASLYANREDTITGMTVEDIPLDSRKVLGRIKLNEVT